MWLNTGLGPDLNRAGLELFSAPFHFAPLDAGNKGNKDVLWPSP